MIHTYSSWLIGALVLLAAVAAFSRIATIVGPDGKTPVAGQYIKNFSSAVSNLFVGAYGR